ncbi:MAG: phospho-sugar mutase [Pirellulales bacterium]
MAQSSAGFDVAATVDAVVRAGAAGQLTQGAVDNIRGWLTEPRYAQYAAQVAELVEAARWKELDDAFWTVIPFGTGGRRGRMYPVGCNVINERTIGESAQGLADYVKAHTETSELSCAIAYDTRHRSTEFARLCAEIMVAAGYKVYFLDEHRSTPELSFLVRYKQCSCGIMVTASHNPPSDNAVKVYWSTGGQVLPPHDKGVIDCVMQVDRIERSDFDAAVKSGRIVLCRDEVDRAFVAQVAGQGYPGPRDVKIVYSPLHGVGTTAVCPALAADGFADVEIYGPHAEPSGDFPNVPQHVANPENTEVFTAIIERARQIEADLILATDPDCDRLGCAAPVTSDRRGEWRTFTGNQIAVLLADYVLDQRRRRGELSPDHYLVKTLVTTEMLRRIGDSYGVRTIGDLLVGFKYIGGTMDEQGPGKFVLGAEESHGYLVGSYARDKDGAVAAMLLSELAAQCRSQRKSLHDKLAALYWQHGYHAERLVNLTMQGSQGMARMQALMQRFRTDPPKTLAGISVVGVRDYESLVTILPGGARQPLAGPKGDLVMLDLAESGNYIAVRPSGTEPKVKFYMFTFVPAEQLADLEMTAGEMNDRLDALAADLRVIADQV